MQPTVSTLDLLQLASGDTLSLQIYKFQGAKPGKKAYLQANLHGAEIVGNAVIHQLIEFFSKLDVTQLQGEIWLIPLCNPLSTNERTHFFSTGRFNSYDGKDWNRIFWDYEKECEDLESFVKSCLNLDLEEIQSQYLQKILTTFQTQRQKINALSCVPYIKQYQYLLQSLCLDATYVVDIHSSSNQGTDYLYCFQSRQDSAKYFGMDYGILMNEYDGDAFDEAFMKPWLALEKQFAELGRDIKVDRESWTLELGSGMQVNPNSVTRGVQGIINYLAHHQMLQLEHHTITQTEITLVEKNNVTKYFSPTGGILQNRVELGSFVSANSPLYQILSFKRSQQKPKLTTITAEKAGYVFDVSTNEAVNQGEYVLTMMEGVQQ
jgi:predicted deacylase